MRSKKRSHNVWTAQVSTQPLHVHRLRSMPLPFGLFLRRAMRMQTSSPSRQIMVCSLELLAAAGVALHMGSAWQREWHETVRAVQARLLTSDGTRNKKVYDTSQSIAVDQSSYEPWINCQTNALAAFTSLATSDLSDIQLTMLAPAAKVRIAAPVDEMFTTRFVHAAFYYRDHCPFDRWVTNRWCFASHGVARGA